MNDNNYITLHKDCVIKNIQVEHLTLQMFMVIDNSVTFDADDLFEDLNSCAMEIESYVSNHGNWKKPILPPEDDCSIMVFQPEIFDFIYARWICPSQINGKILLVSIQSDTKTVQKKDT